MVEKHDDSEQFVEEAATEDHDLSTGVEEDRDQAEAVAPNPDDADGGADEQAEGEESQEEATPVQAEGEEADSAAAAEQEESGSDETDMSDEHPYEDTFVTLTPGEVVKGRVVQVGADEVMVDVGYKSEGRIPLNEIGLKPGESPEDVLAVGDEIEVHILRVDEAEGSVLLSKRRADQRLAWERLEKAQEDDEIIEATITERVKGGLLADVGVRGFVPASHVSRNFVENLEDYVGQTLRLKVIEIDKQKNNVVLSHKEVLEEEYERAKEEAFATLQDGDLVDGIVRRITDFGAFVDIGGGVEGLLHVSEMAWSRVQHPSDVVSEGQKYQVKVLKVDPETERISLSLKETLPDPWESIDERYHVGDRVTGTVTRVVDFGAFVKLEDGVEGLVHISQLADHHVEQPSDVVSPGEEVEIRIVSVDGEKRRIGLSMRQPQESGRSRSRDDRHETRTSSGDAPTVTLGEMFEDLSSYFDDDSDR